MDITFAKLCKSIGPTRLLVLSNTIPYKIPKMNEYMIWGREKLVISNGNKLNPI